MIVIVQCYQYLKREYQAEMESFVHHPELQDMTCHAAWMKWKNHDVGENFYYLVCAYWNIKSQEKYKITHVQQTKVLVTYNCIVYSFLLHCQVRNHKSLFQKPKLVAKTPHSKSKLETPHYLPQARPITTQGK